MFYGWTIVGVTFLTHFISTGFLFYSYGVFFKALAAEFGGSRLGVAVGLTAMHVSTAAFAPWLGRKLDQGSVRRWMLIGAVCMGCGFVAASRIEALWQFYVVFGTLLGLGSAMVGGLSSSTLVSNWFVRRRGTALGIATIGISLSGVVMAPVATQMIAWIGWRQTFVVYGALALLLILPAVGFLVVDRPEERGLLPDGDAHPADPGQVRPVTLPLAPGDQITDHPAPPDWSRREALADRNFWLIAAAVGLNFCANGAVLTHIVAHGTDIGFDRLSAAAVLSVVAGLGASGKPLFGYVTDRIDTRIALGFCASLQAAGVLVFLGAETYPGLLAGGAVFGLGMGGLVPIHGALIGSIYGRYRFGRVMGLMSPCMLPVQILGVPYAGWIFDRLGSYDVAFVTFVGIYALSIAAGSMLKLPEKQPEPQPELSSEFAERTSQGAGQRSQ